MDVFWVSPFFSLVNYFLADLILKVIAQSLMPAYATAYFSFSMQLKNIIWIENIFLYDVFGNTSAKQNVKICWWC